MLATILETIICVEFEKQFPEKFESRKDEPKAMLVSFNKRINYDTEQGYRHLHLAIYASSNYVFVAEMDDWNVISLDDLEYDDGNQDSYIKPGKDYVKGKSDWKRLSYHDSCWRSDGVNRFIWEHRDELNGIDNWVFKKNWYDIVPVSKLSDDRFEKLIRQR